MTLPRPRPELTAVVTGASSGIGAELARQLTHLGYGTTLVARRRERLTALADELRDGRELRVEVVDADLTDPVARALLPAALAERGLLAGILVNNAGVSTIGPAWGTARDEELGMVRTDVEAVVDLCKLFLPAMVARRQGAVLNVASTAAFQPLPGMAGYAASKAFVLSWSQAINCELAGTGVHVTALCPGPVRTEFIDTAGLAGAVEGYPGVVWTDVTTVARAGLDGLAARRPVVIPGALNRLGAVGGQLAPRSVLLPILRRAWPAMRAGQARAAGGGAGR